LESPGSGILGEPHLPGLTQYEGRDARKLDGILVGRRAKGREELKLRKVMSTAGRIAPLKKSRRQPPQQRHKNATDDSSEPSWFPSFLVSGGVECRKTGLLF